MPRPLDSAAVRDWCALARDALGADRAELDAINVFPVADGDTGTNMHCTLDAAVRALDASRAEAADGAADTVSAVVRALARGALLGACGNSGTILAQVLHGMAAGLGEGAGGEGAPGATAGGRDLARALRRAADAAHEAVARPVEGTMLTVARAAADAAEAAADRNEGLNGAKGAAPVAVAAYEGARAALAATTDQLDALRRARVVDAGGSGLATVLGALARTLAEGEAGGAEGEREREGESEADGGMEGGARGGGAGAGAAPGSPAPRSALPVPAPRAEADARGEAHVHHASAEAACTSGASGDADPAGYEVMYLLDAPPASRSLSPAGGGPVGALRERLGTLGDSLVIGGGDGLFSVHLHVRRVSDAGAAVEAGIEAGRPHRVRINALAAPRRSPARPACVPAAEDPVDPVAADSPAAPSGRAVVAVVSGDGLADLCAESGARVLRAGGAATTGEAGAEAAAETGTTTGSGTGAGLGTGTRIGAEADAVPTVAALLAAVRGTGAAEVVLLPNDTALHSVAARAAESARGGAECGAPRISVIPTRAAVQGLAALAVHDPRRRFDDDVVAMTAAAGATRYGEVRIAERLSWTMAGVCRAGDVLGLVEGDVALIGDDVERAAEAVLDRMLAGGGELVTLVPGALAPAGLADRLRERLRHRHLGVDTVVHEGRQRGARVLIGVE